MRVFLAGATGAIGRPLTERLVSAGHEVFALTRSDKRARHLQQQGATPVVCDVFDKDNLRRQVEAAKPDAVIHQLTALPKRIDPRKIRSQLAETNRLRTEGTRNLFDAALAAGANRFIAQSIAFTYDTDGDELRTEDNALYEDPPPSFKEVIDAVRALEDTTLNSNQLYGTVLRYGFFYGPGTVYASDGSFAEDVRRRRIPIAGEGTGVFSFIHVEDAAAATLAALQCDLGGIYNIVDDNPAPLAEWLPAYAEILGARQPMRVPRWLARLLAGSYAIYLMCDQKGVTNEEAKARLGWSPSRSTWRLGFQELA